MIESYSNLYMCSTIQVHPIDNSQALVMDTGTGLSKEELKKRLTKIQYEVTQEKGTERAFTGEYWDHKETGEYNCIVCGEKLFESDTKFDSGCGWPSFYQGLSEKIEEEVDRSHGMVRTEVQCKKCKAHLGHVFDDGPAPTGLRYCINSASINFKGKTK